MFKNITKLFQNIEIYISRYSSRAAAKDHGAETCVIAAAESGGAYLVAFDL